MAFEIVKCYKEQFPALRLIGKRYTDDDRDENSSFGAKWDEWQAKGWFETIRKNANPSDAIDNGTYGLMTINSENHSDFAYWIGNLFPAGTPVPEGFESLDLPENEIGMSWIYGSSDNGEIFGGEPHQACYEKLCENGWGDLNVNAGGEKVLVFFERYNCPRFTTPDEKGNVVLDYGFLLSNEK